jgi:hypothetical protein
LPTVIGYLAWQSVVGAYAHAVRVFADPGGFFVRSRYLLPVSCRQYPDSDL